eukprot:PhF_6_TR37479/c0_g3_i2/m.55240
MCRGASLPEYFYSHILGRPQLLLRGGSHNILQINPLTNQVQQPPPSIKEIIIIPTSMGLNATFLQKLVEEGSHSVGLPPNVTPHIMFPIPHLVRSLILRTGRRWNEVIHMTALNDCAEVLNLPL